MIGVAARLARRANRCTDAAPASSATAAASKAEAAPPITATLLPRSAAKSIASAVCAYSARGRVSLSTAGI